MKQLVEQSDKNSPREYDQIFHERAKSEPHWQDIRRWKTLLKYYKGGNLTDIGCLDSLIYRLANSEYMGDCKYMGTDMAKEAIKQMKAKNPYSNCDFIVDDIYDSKIVDEVSDYTILGEVLEHLDRPKEAVKEAFRITKTGGILAISVPLEEAKEPGAVDKERHLWSFSGKDIEDLVGQFSSKIKFKVLSSKWFPKYSYCFPQLLTWSWKK